MQSCMYRTENQGAVCVHKSTGSGTADWVLSCKSAILLLVVDLLSEVSTV